MANSSLLAELLASMVDVDEVKQVGQVASGAVRPSPVDKVTPRNPTELGFQMLQSLLNGGQAPGQAGQGGQPQSQAQPGNRQTTLSKPTPEQPSMDPVSDAVQKQVLKNTKAQVDEAMAAGVPAEDILSQQSQKSMGLLKSLLGGVGDFIQGGSEAALLGAGITPRSRAQFEQDLRTKSAKDVAKFQHELPLPQARREELDIQGKQRLKEIRETGAQAIEKVIAKAKAEGNEALEATEIGLADLVNLVDAFDAAPTGILGAPKRVGAMVTGSETLEDLRVQGRAFAVSMGKILEQSSRGLSDADREFYMETFNFPAGMKYKDFVGRLNASIKFTNTRLRSSGSRIVIPPAQELVESIRSARGTATPSQSQKPPKEIQIGEYKVRVRGGV